MRRVRSRSISRQPNATSTQSMSVLSSSAVRLITIAMPSMAIRNPAMPPMSVERVSRRAMRTVSSTASVPTTAIATRQPNGVSPKAYSPSAMVHLPTGGWTTNAGFSVKTSRSRHAPVPLRIFSLASSTNPRS